MVGPGSAPRATSTVTRSGPSPRSATVTSNASLARGGRFLGLNSSGLTTADPLRLDHGYF